MNHLLSLLLLSFHAILCLKHNTIDLQISNPAAIYIGQFFNVTITPLGGTPESPTVDLSLSCLSFSSYIIVQTWPNVIIGSPQELQASVALHPATCYLSTPSNQYFYGAQSANFPLLNVPLQFAYPLEGSAFTFPESIPVLVNSAAVPNLEQVPITLSFACSGVVKDTLSVTTGIITMYNSAPLSIGNCSFSVVNLPYYMIAPQPVSFTIGCSTTTYILN